MFLLLRYAFKKLYKGKKQRNICILGIDAAGKSSLLNDIRYKFSKNPVSQSEMLPTVGLNYSQVQFEHFDWTIWDLGGMKRFRGVWESYYQDIDVLVWVVDSSDKIRFEESVKEFTTLIQDPKLIYVPVCVVANKQDKDGVLKEEDVVKMFGLSDLKERKTCVFPTSFAGEFSEHFGVDAILSWIANILTKDETSHKRYTWRKSYHSDELAGKTT